MDEPNECDTDMSYMYFNLARTKTKFQHYPLQSSLRACHAQLDQQRPTSAKTTRSTWTRAPGDSLAMAKRMYTGRQEQFDAYIRMWCNSF